MSELAKKLIEESLRTKNPVLDLGNCGLDGTEPILERLGECDHLEVLSFSDEWYEFDKKSQEWKYRKSSNRGEQNLLVQLPKKLPSNLQSLLVNGSPSNTWKISNITPVAHLKHLIQLELDYNQIKDITPLEKCKKLTQLQLFNNQVQDLKPLEKCIQLTRLQLFNNQIKDLKPLEKCTQLYKLNLNNNYISDLHPLEKCTKLRLLYLANNRITNMPLTLVNALPNLFASGLELEGNPIQNIPLEIIEGGSNAIRNYLKSVENQADQHALNEAKLIFVGVGEVGKTELAEALSEPNYRFKKVRKTTQGIRIKDWILPNCQKEGKTFDFTTHIWDFAGQEINYGTHQFFLTKNSVYVFLWDGRKGEDQSKFDYWLQVIALLSDKAPVFVVQNKVDIYQIPVNEQNWQSTFPNIVEFVNTSCKTGKGIDELRKSVKAKILDLEHIGEIWNKNRVKVRQILENKGKEENYISYREYLQICADNEVNREDAQFLSQQLHDIGVILYFADDFALRDTVVLKPEWATKAAYKLLDNEKENSPVMEGRFHQDILSELWNDPSFDNKHPFLLKLMERFELIFQLE